MVATAEFVDPSAEVLAEAAAVFALLSSPPRLHIVWALAQGECDVTGLAERVGGALPAVSQHLAKLKLAGLVRSRREGRRVVYLIDDEDIVATVHVLIGRLSERTGLPAEHRPGLPAGHRRDLPAERPTGVPAEHQHGLPPEHRRGLGA
ncbi:Transcriptional regulator, ArsR family [[Actinomadura] parvosata subsp. kistnae]|uniref:ArsR/SmtB family transcription factor n=1 Tax=[Actinomadura] parvosata TaxID=1955412 RepID=UPI0009ABCFC3|nr:metalloregulator ArsR/SmtB family transcription factor [Nonomuraea sp. ATCC 55076]SPL89827.1 Transcriptional regulator, ArsR family [Actinomadura parvosata subsp. kistnae]